MARFDNSLHDLRKYGFSFVTALLAANGLISVGGTSTVPAAVKAAILVATMGLIVALKLLDTHYRLFQAAATIRARLLEQRLNLDITNDLSYFYDQENWWKNVQYVYDGFLILTAILGVAILWGSWFLLGLVFLSALVSALLTTRINRQTLTAVDDWTVDSKILNAGTPLRITYTNLDPADRSKARTIELSWSIAGVSPSTVAEKKISEQGASYLLGYFEGHDWLWETEGMRPGLYELQMFSSRAPEAAGRNTSAGTGKARGWGMVVEPTTTTTEGGRPSARTIVQIVPRAKEQTKDAPPHLP